MELASKYNPSDVEGKWYQYWLDNNLFHSEPDGREPYTVVIPPPNVTGVLHMGHMLNNTIQDILVRRARMLGKNACWVPGTDHASIATEAKVVKKLAEQGIKKSDLTREEFLKHAWEWTDEHGGIILKQLRKLGASCDWDRTAFTMDEKRSESVIKVFVDLYNKGLIYRGLRMVNWDPKAQTALSNEEVIYKEEKSKLYYLKYYVVGLENVEAEEGMVIHKDDKGYYAVVATTRPETIMGDTAMCINPKDPKNTWLKGQKVIVPLVGREIPVIEDRYVDIEFGTGCLKVTPAHDTNDYMLGKKHNLETIDIFNPDGTLSPEAGMYVGMDRVEVRRLIAKDLEAAGLLEKVEDYDNKVGYSERNADTAVEPRLCMQWFLRMQHFADIALPPVMNDELKFYPAKYKTTYNNWLENIQDWCISRQLWWGHRIPAYFLPTAEGAEEKFVVANSIEEAVALAQKIEGYENITAAELRQDEDALDTWFSSWLWPISLFDGINNPDNAELNYYYPTADLVTGPDIIFFWVVRMVFSGLEHMNDVPFNTVFIHGLVRDAQGRKMSKSLGNGIDPFDVIGQYGADALRFMLASSVSPGNDMRFSEDKITAARNFCNKIWNAGRFILMNDVSSVAADSLPETLEIEDKWLLSKLNSVVAEVTENIERYELGIAANKVYDFAWDVFCDWYVEIAKLRLNGEDEARKAACKQVLVYVYTRILQLLHPFMPFITEEIYSALPVSCESIMISAWPTASEALSFGEEERRFEKIMDLIKAVRVIRAEKNVPPSKLVDLCVETAETDTFTMGAEFIKRLAKAGSVEIGTQFDIPDAVQAVTDTARALIPLSELVDREKELARLNKELASTEKDMAGLSARLSNEQFLSKAPANVVAGEKEKLEKLQAKKDLILDSIAKLS